MKTLAISTAVAISISALAAAPASAEIVIEYRDINATSQEGAMLLSQRIEDGVREACERPFIRDVRAMQEWEKCKASVREEISEQLSTAGIHV